MHRQYSATSLDHRTVALRIVVYQLMANARRTHDGLADSASAGPRDTGTYVPFGPRNNFATRSKCKTMSLCAETIACDQITS